MSVTTAKSASDEVTSTFGDARESSSPPHARRTVSLMFLFTLVWGMVTEVILPFRFLFSVHFHVLLMWPHSFRTFFCCCVCLFSFSYFNQQPNINFMSSTNESVRGYRYISLLPPHHFEIPSQKGTLYSPLCAINYFDVDTEQNLYTFCLLLACVCLYCSY